MLLGGAGAWLEYAMLAKSFKLTPVVPGPSFESGANAVVGCMEGTEAPWLRAGVACPVLSTIKGLFVLATFRSTNFAL